MHIVQHSHTTLLLAPQSDVSTLRFPPFFSSYNKHILDGTRPVKELLWKVPTLKWIKSFNSLRIKPENLLLSNLKLINVSPNEVISGSSTPRNWFPFKCNVVRFFKS